MFKAYFAYLKDNPEKYWFKRKIFGWGWTPARPQGWLTMLFWVIGVTAAALTIDDNSTKREVWLTFILPTVLLSLTLIFICYKTGEKPKWQWGIPPEENNDY